MARIVKEIEVGGKVVYQVRPPERGAGPLRAQEAGVHRVLEKKKKAKVLLVLVCEKRMKKKKEVSIGEC